jgi:hypothetical protein
MTVMKYFSLKIFLIFASFISCSYIHPNISEAEKTVDLLIEELEQRLTQKYHLEAIGVSVSMPRGIVKKLGIDFQIQGPISKENLRSIIFNSTRDFVSYVNLNKKITPFLEESPFAIKNVEIHFFVMRSDGYEVEHPHIGTAGIRNGKIEYLTFTIVNNIPKDVTEERETYEEAVKILQEQTVSLSNDHDKVVDVKSPENAHPKHDQYLVNEAE